MKRLAAVVLALAMGIAAGHIAAQPSSEEDSAPAKLEQYIRNSLRYVPELANNKIDVGVYEGVARLTGTVDSADEKRKAVRAAEMAGAPVVDDRLIVKAQ